MNRRQFPEQKYLTYGLWFAAGLYIAIWALHLYTGTVHLRGFFGDGALAFLIYLSDSYMFGGDGHWVNLFPIGFPRDFYMLLNALGLQAGLLLNIRDPAALKYIFNFWQFALPGFLYLGLLFTLWRKGHLSWAVFPLIAWAVLSPPIDWTAPNSTRWALPIFWAHFMLVILSGPKLRAAPAFAALALGLAMWSGLYESVMLQAALCCGLGALFWYFRKNKTPLLYATAAIPGAIRALLAYIDSGQYAPNKVDTLFLPHLIFHFWYFGFIGLALALIAAFSTGKIPARYLGIIIFLMLLPGINLLVNEMPNVWWQIGMRFDYVIYSLVLMAWAGFLRLRGAREISFAPQAALIALTAGIFLWASQIDGTLNWWVDCRAMRVQDMEGQKLDIDPTYPTIYAPHSGIDAMPRRACIWDWAEPWTQLLLAPDGKVENWSILTFWQDFSFYKKYGEVLLHTNNWTLNTPSMQESSFDLPLKTPLYDLTPLYEKFGDGLLAKRQVCFPIQFAKSYWHDALVKMDDATRAKMFVCPR